jgi:hypothetical protein
MSVVPKAELRGGRDVRLAVDCRLQPLEHRSRFVLPAGLAERQAKPSEHQHRAARQFNRPAVGGDGLVESAACACTRAEQPVPDVVSRLQVDDQARLLDGPVELAVHVEHDRQPGPDEDRQRIGLGRGLQLGDRLLDPALGGEQRSHGVPQPDHR